MYASHTTAANRTIQQGRARRLVIVLAAALVLATALVAPAAAFAASASITIQAQIAPKVSIRMTDDGAVVRSNVAWRLQLMDGFGHITTVEGLPSMNSPVNTDGAQTLTIVGL